MKRISHMLIRSTALAILATTGALTAAAPARALKFHADLSTIKINVLPGQVVNRAVKLTLEKDEVRTRFSVHAEDWWRSEDDKQSFYRPAGTLARSCAPWLKINPVESVIEPGGTLTARLSIAVPGNVKPGGYWCAVTIDEMPDPLKIMPEGVGVRFLTSVSVGVFVYIAPLDKTVKIVQLDVLNEDGKVTVKVKNEGNAPVGVEGRVEFLLPGETKAAAVAQFSRVTALPEPIRTVLLSTTLPSADKLAAGRWVVRVILDTGMDFYIGAQKEFDIKQLPRANVRPQPVASPSVALTPAKPAPLE